MRIAPDGDNVWTGRLRAVLPQPIRFRVAVLAAKFSDDRSALDTLLRVEDLPGDWFQRRESRWRVGFADDSDISRRASRAKLAAGRRELELVGTSTILMVQAVPFVSIEDAQALLEHEWKLRWSWDLALNLDVLRQDAIEVAPPATAGEHARALLCNTTYKTGVRFTLFSVYWCGAQPTVFGLKLWAPTEFDVFDTTSTLVQLQRSLASRSPIDTSPLS